MSYFSPEGEISWTSREWTASNLVNNNWSSESSRFPEVLDVKLKLQEFVFR